MTDKEKEAIKYLYNIRVTIDESYMLFDEGINVKCGKEMREHISIIFNLIEKHQNRITELEQIEAEHKKINGELRKDVEMLEKSLGVHDEIIARLEERLTENDKIVLDIIKRLENDIKNITATKYDGYTDDYRRCRLKAYKTKTREIKEYIEEKYFGKKVSEE